MQLARQPNASSQKGTDCTGGSPERPSPRKEWKGGCTRAKRSLTKIFFSSPQRTSFWKGSNTNLGPGKYDASLPSNSRVTVMHAPSPPKTHRDTQEANLGPGKYGIPEGPKTSRVTVIHAPHPPHMHPWDMPEKSRHEPKRDKTSGAAGTAAPPQRYGGNHEKNADVPLLPLVHTTGALYEPLASYMTTPAPTAYFPVLPPKGVKDIKFLKGDRELETKLFGESLYKQAIAPGPGQYFPRLDLTGFAGRDRSRRKKYFVPLGTAVPTDAAPDTI